MMPLRRGSYGDPAAVPELAWQALENALYRGQAQRGGTGYTHQWARDPSRARELAARQMASVDSPEEREKAKKLGFRTFRVRREGEPLLPGEIMCPASHEAGKRTTCARCNLCGGTHPGDLRPDISIIAHGAGKANFQPMQMGAGEARRESSALETARRLFMDGWTPDGWVDDSGPEWPEAEPPSPVADLDVGRPRLLSWLERYPDFLRTANAARVQIEQDLMALYRDRMMEPGEIVEHFFDMLNRVLGKLSSTWEEREKYALAELWADEFLSRYSGDAYGS